MADIPDEDLFVGFSIGKSGCFDTLFSRYDVCVYGYIKRNVVNDATAQEITQTLWEKLIDKSTHIASKIQDPGIEFQLKPYVFTMAKNLIADQFRSPEAKLHSHASSLEEIENPDAIVPSDTTDARTLHGLLIDELGQCIERKMTKISDEMRQTFEMTRDGALTYSQAAKALDVSTETIRSRVKTVLMKIKPCLEEFRDAQ